MGKCGEGNECSTLEGRLVREDAGAGDVGRLHGVGIAFAPSVKEFDELMDEVWVGASVSCSLGEAEVVFTFFTAINSAGGEGRNLLGKEVGVVGRFNTRWDFGFGLLGGVKDEGFPFDEGPFDAFFGTINFDGFAVLAGDIKEGAIDEAGEITVLKLDVAAFDSEGRVVTLMHFLADGAGGKAGDVFGFMPTKAK